MLTALVLQLALASDLPTPAERLQAAADAQESLEYEVAREELLALISDPAATEEELLEANLRAGILQRIMGNDVEARLHFLFVLKRRPQTQLEPGLPPKVTSFFLLVRQELQEPEVTAAPAPNPAPAPETTMDPAPTTEDAFPVLPVSLFGVGAAAGGFALVAAGVAAVGLAPAVIFFIAQQELNGLRENAGTAEDRTYANQLWTYQNDSALAWSLWGRWLLAAGAAASAVLAVVAATLLTVGGAAWAVE